MCEVMHERIAIKGRRVVFTGVVITFRRRLRPAGCTLDVLGADFDACARARVPLTFFLPS